MAWCLIPSQRLNRCALRSIRRELHFPGSVAKPLVPDPYLFRQGGVVRCIAQKPDVLLIEIFHNPQALQGIVIQIMGTGLGSMVPSRNFNRAERWVRCVGQVLVEVLEEAEVVKRCSTVTGEGEVIVLGPEVVNPAKGLRGEPASKRALSCD